MKRNSRIAIIIGTLVFISASILIFAWILVNFATISENHATFDDPCATGFDRIVYQCATRLAIPRKNGCEEPRGNWPTGSTQTHDVYTWKQISTIRVEIELKSEKEWVFPTETKNHVFNEIDEAARIIGRNNLVKIAQYYKDVSQSSYSYEASMDQTFRIGKDKLNLDSDSYIIARMVDQEWSDNSKNGTEHQKLRFARRFMQDPIPRTGPTAWTGEPSVRETLRQNNGGNWISECAVAVGFDASNIIRHAEIKVSFNGSNAKYLRSLDNRVVSNYVASKIRTCFWRTIPVSLGILSLFDSGFCPSRYLLEFLYGSSPPKLAPGATFSEVITSLEKYMQDRPPQTPQLFRRQ